MAFPFMAGALKDAAVPLQTILTVCTVFLILAVAQIDNNLLQRPSSRSSPVDQTLVRLTRLEGGGVKRSCGRRG